MLGLKNRVQTRLGSGGPNASVSPGTKILPRGLQPGRDLLQLQLQLLPQQSEPGCQESKEDSAPNSIPFSSLLHPEQSRLPPGSSCSITDSRSSGSSSSMLLTGSWRASNFGGGLGIGASKLYLLGIL